MTTLADACQELASWLAIAETLTTIPDTQPSARPAGKPGTRLPGNVAALCAVMDAHAGVRTMEDEWRGKVTGTALERGGSDGNTAAALQAIPALAAAVPEEHQARYDGQGRRKTCRCRHCEASAHLTRWALVIQQLPAIDTAPRWIPIRPGPDGLPPKCPHCETFSLRLCVEYGQVACWLPGCEDNDGNRPRAQLEMSRISGQPILAWSDGIVQLWRDGFRFQGQPAGMRSVTWAVCAAWSGPAMSSRPSSAARARGTWASKSASTASAPISMFTSL